MTATIKQNRGGTTMPWWQRLLVVIALVAALWGFGGLAFLMSIEAEERTAWLRAITDESVEVAVATFVLAPAAIGVAAAWAARRAGALFPAVLMAGPAAVLVYHGLLVSLGTRG